jgi:LuxR family maltose regulon positive regulatory protein
VTILTDQAGTGLRFRTAPPVVPGLFVRRTRLNSLLDRAVDGPVTLVSAGPGSGKTLTLADWTQHTAHRVAWLSIEPSDNQLSGFWSALIAAIRACGCVEPGSVLSDLAPAASFGVEDAMRVVDALAQLPAPLVIVLDDVQHLRDRDVLESMQKFLDRPAPTVRLILSARYDPALRLQRLAISDRLSEIRADQLAFTNAEADQLLSAGGLPLEPATTARLVDRTRGWAAGLRLALSGLDRDAPEEAVTRLRGSDRPVADYLMQEVLGQLSEQDRRFLLRSSVAEPVTADLAQVLTGEADAQAQLEKVEVGTGFIVGLGGGRSWFTWHPLFRELLLHQVAVEYPGLVGELHGRAAGWLVEHGDPLAAIRHLTAAGDWVAIGHVLTEWVAPDVVTAAAPTLVETLAPVAARADVDPTTTTLLASALCNFHRHDYSAMLRDVKAAEAAVDNETPRASLGADLLIASLRMAYSHARQPGALTNAARHVLKVIDQLSRHQVPVLERYRAIATTNLGFGLLLDGEFRAAETALADGEKSCGRWGLGLSELTARGHLALLAAIRGQHPLAGQLADQARATADQHGWSPEPQASAHMIALTMVALDTGRLDDADHLITLGTSGTNPHLASRAAFATLAVEVALARHDQQQAERRAAALTDLAPRLELLPPMLAGWTTVVQANHLLAQGQVDTARELLNQVPNTGFTKARRVVSLARCSLAQDDPKEALRTLTSSLPACADYLTVAVDARIVASLAAQRLRLDAQALELFTDAVGIAAEPGIIGPFRTAGGPLHPLLDRHRTVVSRHPEFADALREAFSPARTPGPSSAVASDRILTDRERAVLPYLATHLKAGEIASELYLSVNTVKSHQQAIYRKLGVSSRRDAVDRGRELGLI